MEQLFTPYATPGRGIVIILLFFTFTLVSCAKIEHRIVSKPAYLRVFNNLNFKATVENQEQSLSTLTMLINPVSGADGMPVSAETVGDFLVTRAAYAPPYPSHIGNSLEVYNPEYPGKERVIAGPILNGFDLSSWAQIPSGKTRIVFYARPRSEVPFFNLEARYRTSPLIDTLLDLQAAEVYTLHVLQKDYNRKENGVLLRQESFHKLPLADSLIYVNFYNMSAKGFWASNASKPKSVNILVGLERYQENYFENGIRDEMNVYSSLFDVNAQNMPSLIFPHAGVYLTHLKRETEAAAVAKYCPLPLFAGSDGNFIQTRMFQEFNFLAPTLDIKAYTSFALPLSSGPQGFSAGEANGQYAKLTCFQNGNGANIGGRSYWGVALPNLIVTTHSGTHNPRSFGTVNSIEIVNGSVFLTTVQRVYAPPVY